MARSALDAVSQMALPFEQLDLGLSSLPTLALSPTLPDNTLISNAFKGYDESFGDIARSVHVLSTLSALPDMSLISDSLLRSIRSLNSVASNLNIAPTFIADSRLFTDVVLGYHWLEDIIGDINASQRLFDDADKPADTEKAYRRVAAFMQQDLPALIDDAK